MVINLRLNLAAIPKEKIFHGKKGKYIDVTVFVDDNFDQYGNNAKMIVSQSKEQRQNNVARIYLANGKTAGNKSLPEPAPQSKTADPLPTGEGNFHGGNDDDLPF